MAADMDSDCYGPVSSGVSHSRPQFPNWYTDDVLLYHAGEAEHCTLYSSELLYCRPPRLYFSTSTALLGSDSSTSTMTSFADANTSQSEGSRGVGSGPQKNIATFGVSDTHGTEEAPRVHARRAWPATLTEVATEEFDLGTNDAGAPIRECHHPAWSVSGESILCTNHRPAEPYPRGAESDSRLLYMYSRTGSTWSGAELVFTPLTPDDLSTDFGSLFPMEGDPSCQIYTYKYAEWCGTDNYIVATVFCSDDDYVEENPIFSSRVFLIQRSPLIYIDLTRFIEQELGLSVGEMHGIYSTCALIEGN